MIIDLFKNEIATNKLYGHQQTPFVVDTLMAALITRNNQKESLSIQIKEVFIHSMPIRI